MRDDAGWTYNSIDGKNCEIPPRTMITATARFTMRLDVEKQG